VRPVAQATGPLQVAILCGLDVPGTRFANACCNWICAT